MVGGYSQCNLPAILKQRHEERLKVLNKSICVTKEEKEKFELLNDDSCGDLKLSKQECDEHKMTLENELKEREQVVQNNIRESLKKHRVSLRNHVIFIRDSLREEFDDFFNNLLSSIRKDWNLFTVQEQLIKETRRFNNNNTFEWNFTRNEDYY